MSREDNKPSTKRFRYTALGLAIGLVFGGILGLFTHNVVIFAGGGMVLGLAISYALENRSK